MKCPVHAQTDTQIETGQVLRIFAAKHIGKETRILEDEAVISVPEGPSEKQRIKEIPFQLVAASSLVLKK